MMQSHDILETWIEISVYLNKSERTCRRWGKELGLPVHRIDDLPKTRVFAYKHELDRWVSEKLNSSKKYKKGKRILNRLSRTAAIIVASLILCLSGFLLWKSFFAGTETLPLSERPHLIVLPFDNLTGEERYDQLRVVIPNLIITLFEL